MSTLQPHFMTLKEWEAANPDVEKIEERCGACDGTGYKTCNCCGNETACKECDTEGVILTVRVAYERQREIDKALFQKWVKSMGGE